MAKDLFDAIEEVRDMYLEIDEKRHNIRQKAVELHKQFTIDHPIVYDLQLLTYRDGRNYRRIGVFSTKDLVQKYIDKHPPKAKCEYVIYEYESSSMGLALPLYVDTYNKAKILQYLQSIPELTNNDRLCVHDYRFTGSAN